MPQQQQSPKVGLWRRMFGEPLSEANAAAWPELEQEWHGREIEMPTEAAGVNSVRPMNFLEKYFFPKNYAQQYPWGTIALNRDLMNQDKIDLGDTLVHELTHVGQDQKTGFLGRSLNNARNMNKDYLDRPEELEAFGAEMKRPVLRNDIFLKSKRK